MTNSNAEPRFDGRVPPYQSGVLSEDFTHRLTRLKEASGLTWSGFADAIGADKKQVRRWRKKGVEPSGGPMLSLVRFAGRIPGGLDILMGEGFQMNLWERDDDEDQDKES